MITEARAMEVLAAAKAKCGRYWKSAVRMAWETGRYDREGLKHLTSELQQIRNTLGPSWLYRLRLPAAPTPEQGHDSGLHFENPREGCPLCPRKNGGAP